MEGEAKSTQCSGHGLGSWCGTRWRGDSGAGCWGYKWCGILRQSTCAMFKRIENPTPQTYSRAKVSVSPHKATSTQNAWTISQGTSLRWWRHNRRSCSPWWWQSRSARHSRSTLGRCRCQPPSYHAMLADSITALWNLQLICSIDFGEAIAFPVASPRPKQKHWNPVLPTWVRASFSLPVGHQKHCLPRAAASALFSLSRRSCTWSPFPQLAAARWLRCVAHQSPLQRGHATWQGHSDGLPGVRFWGQDVVNNQNGGSMWVLCCLAQWLVCTILGASLHLYCLLVLQIWRHYASETCERTVEPTWPRTIP